MCWLVLCGRGGLKATHNELVGYATPVVVTQDNHVVRVLVVVLAEPMEIEVFVDERVDILLGEGCPIAIHLTEAHDVCGRFLGFRTTKSREEMPFRINVFRLNRIVPSFFCGAANDHGMATFL
jgi:hypothetical protein